ncbi:DNA-binding protein [bacterium]|nr:DNA-binding protein [bacterium]
MKLTQYDRVLDHLQRNGKLSQKQAIRLFGAYRLSAIIHRLRKDGYNISSNFKSGKNRFGDTVSWAEYKLEA